ncbi:MAG: hypothetical protein ABWY25_12330 [Paenisporosarcina sp.]
MATVTGLTAERMIEMEAATVIDGQIEGDNLVLVTRGGTEIDAGNVRGPKGDKGDIGVSHVIQDEGTDVAQQPNLNFVGSRIEAQDDPFYNRTNIIVPQSVTAFNGYFNPSATYTYGDIVIRYGAFWIWDLTTINWEPDYSLGPGIDDGNWRLFGGIPVMTQVQWELWTSPSVGNQCWVTPAGGTKPPEVRQRLLTYNEEGRWCYSDRTEQFWINCNTPGNYPPGAHFVAFPETFHKILVPTIVTTHANVNFNHVSGNGVEVTFRLEGPGGIIRYIGRASVGPGCYSTQISGTSTHWVAIPGTQNIQGTLQSVYGDGTFRLASGNPTGSIQVCW